MGTPSEASARRRIPRCPLAVPVRVTVVRSGVPNAIPGRSLDLGEGGIAAVLGGELTPGDPVAVEFLLPEMGLGLHAKAVVRHRTPLRCGLAFQTLSVEQRAIIRRWTHRHLGGDSREPAGSSSSALKVGKDSVLDLQEKFTLRGFLLSRRFLSAAGLVALLALALFWWRWQAGWGDLRAQAAQASAGASTHRIALPPGVMEPLLVYKEDPALPEGMRRGTAGAVLLNVVIGRDGTVIDQHPVGTPDALSRAAMNAVKLWRFQPYRVRGNPVEIETTLTVEFQAK
ncbi:MAG TPA: PilZ domain-containing protein [Terriglobales bacterium]|nr:PilZ domain-containing protein [Terriglobales bacterium]